MMVRVEACTDPKVIEAIFHHPEVWPWVCDDLTEHADVHMGAAVAKNLCAAYVGWVGDDPLVAFLFFPRSPILVELHSAALPGARGELTAAVFSEAARLVFETGVKKIMTWVPVRNERAYKKALACGFKVEGLCTNSFLRDGLLWDQWIMGLGPKET